MLHSVDTPELRGSGETKTFSFGTSEVRLFVITARQDEKY
jgi:hypothetical protein